MIRFITKGEGKSREEAVLVAFRSVPGAAGFHSVKIESEGRRIGYDLVDLKSGASVPLAREREHIPSGWRETLSHGHFSFSEEGFKRGEEIVIEALESGVKAIFLDEIGKLELEGRGFAHLIGRCLKAGADLYIGCRKMNIEAIREEFAT
jgi:nucleoside-triphosphatase THEP1